MNLRLACVLAAATQLSGCFFVFIPGSLIDKVAGAPQYCVGSNVRVGDTFRKDGDLYRVTQVVGDSQYYCRQQPEWRRMGVNAVAIAPDSNPVLSKPRESAPAGPETTQQ
jgi:hypothetical protein